jgi:murein DD-endopeptidase MepM/ murein hydrolase activator NlpD
LKKRILPVVMTMTMAALLLVPYAGYAAKNSSKIDQELEQLQKRQAASKQLMESAANQMSWVQTEKAQTTQDLSTLMNQVDQASKKLADLNNQIDTVTKNLKENGKKLDEAEARVASRDQMLKSRLRLMYTNGSVSYMDVLLSATNFSDFLNRLEALKSIVNQDKEILASNKKDKETIAAKKVETEKELTLVSGLFEQQNNVRAELQVKENEKEVKIAALSKKEKELEQISEENEQLLTQFAAQEAALQAKKRAESKTDTKGIFTYSGGKFGYPLAAKAPMTSDFVLRINPVTGKSENHKGIDFGAPNGTSILAAENGVVIVASWWNGYGNTVIIDHGDGYWTLYGHIRNDGTVVNKGDTVKRGQKIAEVGSTGQSTGNHLHFEVRKNEVPVDPKPFLR